jgi:hypothetical protein
MDNGNGSDTSKTKLYAILGGIGALVVLALIIWGLYSLGGADQAPLERLRDVAIIFIILLFALTVVLLAAITAALGFLALQIKDRVIPLLEEGTARLKQVRGTTTFVSEEAVKPIVSAAGSVARFRAMAKNASDNFRR